MAIAIALGIAVGWAHLDLRSTLGETRDDLRTQTQITLKTRSDLQATSASLEAFTSRLTEVEQHLNAEPETAKLAAVAKKSVFTVITNSGSGSGWVVTSKAGRSTLVTNFHVIADDYVNGDRTVKVRRGDITYDGRIVDTAEADDLALIEVKHQLPKLDVATKRPSVGDSVLALGSPLGLGGTVTSGIVSAYRSIDSVSYMQFSAPISPGNSGGPVIDKSGKVVGVAVIKFLGGGVEGIGLAIPSERICDALDVC